MTPVKKVSARKYTGLGDVVAAVAQPIARTLDRAVGTRIEHCGSCAKRRATLNRMVPFSHGNGNQGLP